MISSRHEYITYARILPGYGKRMKKEMKKEDILDDTRGLRIKYNYQIRRPRNLGCDRILGTHDDSI